MSDTPRTITAERDLAALLKDNEEQARLLGMSGERECDLRGKVRKLERDLAAARSEVERLRVATSCHVPEEIE
jgi:hypothetical protein